MARSPAEISALHPDIWVRVAFIFSHFCSSYLSQDASHRRNRMRRFLASPVLLLIERTEYPPVIPHVLMDSIFFIDADAAKNVLSWV